MLTAVGGGSYVVKKFPEEAKRIDIGNYYSDYSLIKSILGWEPKVSLEAGLRLTIEYYRKNLQHYL